MLACQATLAPTVTPKGKISVAVSWLKDSAKPPVVAADTELEPSLDHNLEAKLQA